MPYIEKARAAGFEVLVTNTNDNDRDGKLIKDNSSPEDHARYVWTNIVQQANAKSIAVVAHSYGGVVTTSLSKKFTEDFESQVFAVALTDSVHSSRNVNAHLVKIGINYVSSSTPLGTPARSFTGDMTRVSAGHPKHEMSSYSCIEALFEFVNEKYEAFSSASGSSSPKAKQQKTDEL